MGTFDAPHRPAAPPRGTAPDVGRVTSTLQFVWNEYCEDAGCHPDCFEVVRHSGGAYELVADFRRGNFARMVADALGAAAPPDAPDLRTALTALLAACERADADGDLSAHIDGSLLDAARAALQVCRECGGRGGWGKAGFDQHGEWMAEKCQACDGTGRTALGAAAPRDTSVCPACGEPWFNVPDKPKWHQCGAGAAAPPGTTPSSNDKAAGRSRGQDAGENGDAGSTPAGVDTGAAAPLDAPPEPRTGWDTAQQLREALRSHGIVQSTDPADEGQWTVEGEPAPAVCETLADALDMFARREAIDYAVHRLQRRVIMDSGKPLDCGHNDAIREAIAMLRGTPPDAETASLVARAAAPSRPEGERERALEQMMTEMLEGWECQRVGVPAGSSVCTECVPCRARILLRAAASAPERET